ncbi:DUF1638 domain-containing protein [Methanolobus sp. ZRKC3]|uniref:DUF1638 domain-containing protein n=1 Tax=Methanolobus sp. ZRKC3 TaxID=3125786 RepID=UPI0032492DF7
MPALSIIACRIFEDEIIDVIENDPEIEEVIVVENENCFGLVQKLNDTGIPYKLMPIEKITTIPKKENNFNVSLTVNILELAFHGEPRNLKEFVYGNVKNMASNSDGIFLFYGLCGNVLRKLEKDFESFPCPVSILKDDNGKVVDDCIGTLVGGRKSFLDLMSSFNRTSTLLMTPMWVHNWKEMFKHSGFVEDPDDIETTKFVLESMGYKTVVKVNNGLSYIKDFEKKVEDFAKLFDFNIIEIEGNLEITRNSYNRFKSHVISHTQIMENTNMMYREGVTASTM